MSKIIIKRGAEILFTEDEHKYLTELADLKIKIKLQKGIPIKSYSNRMTPAQKEIVGIGAEFTACRLLGLSDPSQELIANTTGHDINYNGFTIDVKGTNSQKILTLGMPKYQVDYKQSKKEIFANYYFLIQQKTRLQYKFIGCATPEQFFQIKNIGYYPGNNLASYKVPASQLHDFAPPTKETSCESTTT